MKQSALSISDIAPEDYKYIVDKPDRDFSPEKNRETIKKVIKDTEKFFNSLDSTLQKDKDNRIDVLSSYAMYTFSKSGHKTLDQYLGKQKMAELYGERIIEKLRILESIQQMNRENGNTDYQNFTTN